MNFNVTDIKFDFEGDFDDPLTLEEKVQITFDSLDRERVRDIMNDYYGVAKNG